jgi:hypothetical protein
MSLETALDCLMIGTGILLVLMAVTVALTFNGAAP